MLIEGLTVLAVRKRASGCVVEASSEGHGVKVVVVDEELDGVGSPCGRVDVIASREIICVESRATSLVSVSWPASTKV